jgi:hypothetical protein
MFVLAFSFSLPGVAQNSFDGSITPSATIQKVITFILRSNSSPTIIFSNGSDYVTGYSISNFNTISVKSNSPWNLYISSSTAYFTNSGVYSTPNTPASILSYGVEGKSTQAALTATPRLLNAGANGSDFRGGNTFNISFAANTGYNYGPGTYTISTVYTITAQ